MPTGRAAAAQTRRGYIARQHEATSRTGRGKSHLCHDRHVLAHGRLSNFQHEEGPRTGFGWCVRRRFGSVVGKPLEKRPTRFGESLYSRE